jgi:hypothetical protein
MSFVDDAQEELVLARAPQSVDVPIEMIRGRKNKGAAFTLACDASGLDDKEIYMQLSMDKAQFSRIKSGTANLDDDSLRKFCDVVGNRIYPEWQAYQVGCTLVMVKTEAERRAEEAEKRAQAAEAENRLMRQLLAGRAAA